MIAKYVSKFRLKMEVEDNTARIVDLSLDGSDAGLYGRLRNDFGTPLLARGPREELEQLLVELRKKQ